MRILKEYIDRLSLEYSLQDFTFSVLADLYNLQPNEVKRLFSANTTTEFGYTIIEGESMIDMDIKDGDIIIYSRGVSPASGDLVLVNIQDIKNHTTTMYIKKLWISLGISKLISANPDFESYEIKYDDKIEVIGIPRLKLRQTDNMIIAALPIDSMNKSVSIDTNRNWLVTD